MKLLDQLRTPRLLPVFYLAVPLFYVRTASLTFAQTLSPWPFLPQTLDVFFVHCSILLRQRPTRRRIRTKAIAVVAAVGATSVTLAPVSTVNKFLYHTLGPSLLAVALGAVKTVLYSRPYLDVARSDTVDELSLIAPYFKKCTW